MGRLPEAEEPFRVSRKKYIEQEAWGKAATTSENLTILYLTQGLVEKAVAVAKEGVDYADRSKEAFQRLILRADLADALHQRGEREKAEALFQEAEEVQKGDSLYHTLYSLQGFRYCDLLLTEAEREAGKAEGGITKEVLLAVCRAVSERAARTLKWVEVAGAPLFTIAVDPRTRRQEFPGWGTSL